MPSFCMVVNCGSNAARDVGVSFFRIPSIYASGNKRKICSFSKERHEKWISALKRDDLTESKIKNGRICSKHFHSGKPAALHDKTNPDWIPTKNMGHTSGVQVKSPGRYTRASRREMMRQPGSPQHSTPEELSLGIEPPSTPNFEQELSHMRNTVHSLRKELLSLKLDEEFFKNDNQAVSYYTGFPAYDYLESIYSTVKPYLPDSKRVTKFQQLLITLMKLRLNLDFTDLGYRFQCHRTTVGRIFTRIIEILYIKLNCFIKWPAREDIQLNMPQSFKEVYGNKTTVIIDCFEVFIERPSTVDAAAKTWSHYKHHHTVKFLIGISPQGVIIFISNAYGGRASDKFITEDCGILNKLSKGDLILADRGFSIDDSVNIYCAEVKYPAFTKGRNRLNAKEVEDTRKLAHVRIHVERVIGLLKRKFRIFQDTLPISPLRQQSDDFSLIDKMIVVCCVFVNLCPGIVPLE